MLLKSTLNGLLDFQSYIPFNMLKITQYSSLTNKNKKINILTRHSNINDKKSK